MQRAKHIILFGHIYSDTPCSNVVSGIHIRISNIATICTGKLLAFSKRVFFRSDMVAHATGLTCVSGWDNNQFNSIKQCLVGIAVALSAPIEYRFILRSILSLPIEGRKSIIKNLTKDCLN